MVVKTGDEGKSTMVVTLQRPAWEGDIILATGVTGAIGLGRVMQASSFGSCVVRVAWFWFEVTATIYHTRVYDRAS